ncbi:response regulator [Nitriliruptor alkaliphilus]|uniref:response regulator n=1 Tax=Nitriliruptor alkaliphilus TaxID=427918 RepID=UPI0006981AAF|nr:response regulator [Nitriliruptor alkaliphilus]
MIRVLVVEDEPVVARAHRTFVERTEGFTVVGSAGTGAEALAVLKAQEVDVVLLDLGLPDIPGLELCQTIRRAGLPVDVIAVTSARDVEVVRAAVALGIVQYVVKPFTAAMLREKLERYRDYHRSVAERSGPVAQHEVDAMLTTLHRSPQVALPKGLTETTMQQVIDALRDDESGATATDVGTRIGVSRVTARRYLEHLVQIGMAERTARYGGPGRPEHHYRLGAAS